MFLYETTHSFIETLSQNKVTSIKHFDSTSKEILLQLFALYDQAFNWEFTQHNKHVLKNLIGNFSNTLNAKSSTNVNLEPTPEFKDFFLNPNLISILFKCYSLVRDDPEISHATIQ
jgi:hypothetical protein